MTGYQSKRAAAQDNLDSMKDEAMKLALEALENGKRVRDGEGGTKYQPWLENAAITALREALAQPAQQDPEIVERVRRFTGKTMRTARNPNITARECIELANWIATNTTPPAQQEPVLQDIEQYRLQMAAICTAAIGYWKEGDGIHPDYDTLALRDVAALYAKYDALYKAQPAQRILELEALLEHQTARIVDLQTHIDNFEGEDR